MKRLADICNFSSEEVLSSEEEEVVKRGERLRTYDDGFRTDEAITSQGSGGSVLTWMLW